MQIAGRVYYTLLGDGLEQKQESGEETHMIRRRVSALRGEIMDAGTEDRTGLGGLGTNPRQADKLKR